MSELLRGEAIVLRTYKLGESDLICVLLTRDDGKVRAVAKGVRKTTSRLGARMEVLDHVDVQLARGRSELMTVRQVAPLGTARALREDYDRLAASLSVVEVADLATIEHHPDPEFFEMVRRALVALEQATDPSVASTAFLLKTLAHDGAAPILDRCATCGEDTELVAFDLMEGGLLCRTCRRGRPVSPEAVVLLRRMLLGGLAGVLAEPHPEGAAEVASVAIEAMEAHLGRRLRAARTTDAL
jgi:DNA repair protein RecO (recombination protein O)